MKSKSVSFRTAANRWDANLFERGLFKASDPGAAAACTVGSVRKTVSLDTSREPVGLIVAASARSCRAVEEAVEAAGFGG